MDTYIPPSYLVIQEVIELLSSFRAIMRKNFETLDVDKIQERWYVYDDIFHSTQITHHPGAAVMNHGSFENAGRSCLKTFVTWNRKSLIPPEQVRQGHAMFCLFIFDALP